MRLVDRILRRPTLVVVIVFAATLFFAMQIPNVEFDNDLMSFVPDDQPERLEFDRLDDLYDTDLAIVVAMEAIYGTIFEPHAVSTVIEITERLQNIADVSDVESLATADFISGTAEGMQAGQLLENFAGTSEEIRELKQRLRSWEVYDRAIVADDHQSTQILILVEPGLIDGARERVLSDIEAVLADYRDESFAFYVAGEPVIDVLLSTNMRADVATLIPIVIAVVIVLLFTFFRRTGGVVLPLLTVLISTVWTVGLMALLDVHLSLVATVIPVLLIAVGSAYGIHIVNHYYDELDRRADTRDRIDRDVNREVVVATVRRVGVPVLTAGLTTMAGFGALITSRVGPMRDFGLFTAIGVGTALIVALTLIPALLLMRRSSAGRWARNTGRGDRALLLSVYRFVASRKRRFLLFVVALLVVAAWGSSMLIVDNEMIGYFKATTSIRIADEFLRTHFLGTRSFNINVVGEEPGDLTRPEILTAMDDLALYLEDNYEEIPRVFSYSDFIKRMNQVMHVGQRSPYTEGAGDLPGGVDTSDSDEANEPAIEGSLSFDSDDGFQVEDSLFEDSDFGELFGSALVATEGEPTPAVEPLDRASGAPTALSYAGVLNDALALASAADIETNELIRLVNRRVNYQGSAYYEIPNDPARYALETRDELSNLIAQYLLIYSGELRSWADDALQPRQARMSVQLRTSGNEFTRYIVPEIHRFAAARFPAGYQIEVSGVAIIERAVTELITNAQVMSIIVSLSLVFTIVALTFRSLVAGVYGIVPLGLTILVNFGVMGFFGIKLDVATAMVASIAIGIGIDYTIHFLSAYRHYRAETDDVVMVESRVLAGTGKAIGFNAASVGIGFAVLLLSQFNPLAYLGLLIAITMLTSSVASITVLPVLLDLFRPRFILPQKGDTR